MKHRHVAAIVLIASLTLLFACQSYQSAKPTGTAGDRIRIVKFTIPNCG